MALGTSNIGSTGTALTDPSSLLSGSQGQSDLGNLLQSDDQVWQTGATPINTGALNSSIDSAYGSATSAVDSSGGSGIGTDLGSIISSIAGSNLGTLAGYGGVYSLLASQASKTQQQNDTLAGGISAIGAPLVSEGQGLTKAFSQGQLTTPFQQQVTAAEAANQNTATSQGQQVARLLANSGGGQNVQGAQASESQQITNAQTQANTNAIAQAFQNELSSGTGLVATGGPYVQSGIQQEIASNTALQGQLASLMGTLANAYARQTAGSGSGSGTPTGSLGSMLSKILSGSSGGAVSPGSLTSGISALTNSNVASLGNSGFDVSSSDSSLFGNIDQNMAADTASNLDTSNLNNASISFGDLVSSESDAGGVASDIGDFSAGSAAAGTTLGSTAANISDSEIYGGVPTTNLSEVSDNLPAANFGPNPALSIAGDAGAIAGLVTNPTNPVNDIKGLGAAGNIYQAATGGTGAASGAISSIAPYLGIAGAAAGLALSDYQLLDPKNVPDSLRSMPAGGTLGRLPSGNTILEDNGVGVGLGTQQTQGSGEIYQVGANGQPQWIGQADSGKLEQDYTAYQQAQKGYTVGQGTQVGQTTPTQGTGILSGVTLNNATHAAGSGIASQAANATTQVAMTPAQQKAQEQAAASNMASIYASTGGAAKWGASEEQWMATMMSVLGSVSPGTEWART